MGAVPPPPVGGEGAGSSDVGRVEGGGVVGYFAQVGLAEGESDQVGVTTTGAAVVATGAAVVATGAAVVATGAAVVVTGAAVVATGAAVVATGAPLSSQEENNSI